MGKPTGFLEYERTEARSVEPKERIKNFNEFHVFLSKEKQREQAARCMDCGVPFCQSGMTIAGMTSGCPLHNLVPEWNDLVYSGNWQQAYNRLHKTNNFPEFTSRVCPALCEKACTCGHWGNPVTVRDNEHGVIETAYKMGYAGPHIPKVHTGKKVAIIGSGPSGLAERNTAIHATCRLLLLLFLGKEDMELIKILDSFLRFHRTSFGSLIF